MEKFVNGWKPYQGGTLDSIPPEYIERLHVYADETVFAADTEVADFLERNGFKPV